jgi:hypothetical protein
MSTPSPAEREPRIGRLELDVAIVQALADELDESSLALEPLATSFDPEALQRFVDSTTVTTRISLELSGCTLEIDETGGISVRSGESGDE